MQKICICLEHLLSRNVHIVTGNEWIGGRGGTCSSFGWVTRVLLLQSRKTCLTYRRNVRVKYKVVQI